MNKHINIPIFVPHEGCPNDCVFCNQRKISGKEKFDPKTVESEIEVALSTIDSKNDVEIAFFGGSFTGIEHHMMEYLLQIAAKYIEKGRVQSIRISTRPDYISENILEILKKYYVKTIEIGFQSFYDDVLRASKRGHTIANSYNAAKLINEYGFELVGQMMTGLPNSNVHKEIFTASEIVRIGAMAARIYPTVVFYDTELYKMTARGEYVPLSLEKSVESAYCAYKVFLENKIPIIRVGLCAADNLFEDGVIYRGGYHQALGELVESRIMYDKISELLNNNGSREITIQVAPGMTSKAIGHKKENRIKLFDNYGIKKIKIIENPELEGFQVKI